jgi:hypothetical protein
MIRGSPTVDLGDLKDSSRYMFTRLVLTSVAGAFTWLGNWNSGAGLRGPVITGLAGSSVVLMKPSGGRSGLPNSGSS